MRQESPCIGASRPGMPVVWLDKRQSQNRENQGNLSDTGGVGAGEMGTGRTAIESEENLSQLLDVLDEKSRAILWHLWWHGHAEISELRNLIDTPGDFEVLHRLKDVINEESQKLWGKPMVGFEQSKLDPVTGEKVLFRWWFLNRESVPIPGGNRPLVDVLNEKNDVMVIAQLPASVDPDDTDIQVRNGLLKVRLGKRSTKASPW